MNSFTILLLVFLLVLATPLHATDTSMSNPLVKRTSAVRRKQVCVCCSQQDHKSTIKSPLETLVFAPSKLLLENYAIVGIIQVFFGVLFFEILGGASSIVGAAAIILLWCLGKLNYKLDKREMQMKMLKWLLEQEDEEGERDE